jgi:hypothetical protein
MCVEVLNVDAIMLLYATSDFLSLMPLPLLTRTANGLSAVVVLRWRACC